MKTSKNTTLVLSILLAIAGNFNAGAENVTYYIGGSGEGHYTNLGAAVTAAHSVGDKDVTFILTANTNETSAVTLSSGDNFTVKSPVGERHAVVFASSVNAVCMIGVGEGTVFTTGGSDSGAAIFQSNTKVLFRVIDGGVLNIKDNSEITKGDNCIWITRSATTTALPEVNMSGGVIHSATNWCINVQEGHFNMTGGYICGRYTSTGTTVPAATGAGEANQILNYDNVVNKFSGKEYLAIGDIMNYIIQCYGSSSATCGAIAMTSLDSHLSINGGNVCGIYSSQAHSVIIGAHGTSYSYTSIQTTSGEIQKSPILSYKGLFDFMSGKIFSNYASEWCAGINLSTDGTIDHVTLNMSGNALIAYTEGKNGAGGVRMFGGGTFNMSGGKIMKTVNGKASAVRATFGLFTLSGNSEISYNSSYSSDANYGGSAIGATISVSVGSSINTDVILNGGEIHHNKTFYSNGGAISATNKGSGYSARVNLEINGTKIHDNEAVSGGGIYIGGNSDIIVKGNDDGSPTEIYNNKSSQDGGGIYLGASKGMTGSIITYNCKIYNNTSTSGSGGGIRTDYSPVTINAGTEIYNHNINGVGAGIYLGTQSSFIQNGGKIYSNTTQKSGAGVYVSDGTVTINGGEITGNTAKNSGGGIYAAKGNVTILNATIGKTEAGNTAQTGNGGAMYVAAGNLGITDTQITGNIATAQDGGAFYVSGGTVTLSGENNFVSNHAGRNGGSLCLAGGSLNVSEGSSFTENTAHNGAGAYIGGGGLTMTGGVFAENTATRNGGGAYVSGGTVTFNGNIHDNNAANGAGLYLASGAQMTYTGGIMSGNNAKVSGQAISNTAYYGRTGTLPIEGCGGGIYLKNGPSSSKKTSLKFQFPEGEQTFGLYGNTADKAGQEILAEGGNTDITLPAIANMKLAGFEGQDANPNWYQDYFTDDDEYGDNVDEYTGDHHAVTNKVSHIDRYKNIMSHYGGEFVQHLIPDETLGNIKNKYLAITLGFSMLDLTVTANGLLGGETALVKLIRYGSSGQKTYDVMLKKGESETAASKTLLNMPWGTYSIIPNNSWNWHYEPINPLTNIRIGDAAQYEIVLDYNHRSVAEQPLHYDVHD